LWGLGEVPSSWPPAALEAQAIAARTYALLKLNRLRAECDCNIYNTTVDQNFVGYAKEIEKIYGVRWKAAVNRTFVDSATALTVTMNGLPINAFYFSSSGGATQNIKDVWGSEFSYLQGVPDTWSTSMTLNPRYAAWVRRVPQEVMAKTFALPDVISYSIDSRTVTGSVSSITALSSNGKKATLTGEIFRAGVKLPSTWFDDSIRSFWVQKFRDECLQVSFRRNLICLM
jgi:SpoIID/LytB domain protein